MLILDFVETKAKYALLIFLININGINLILTYNSVVIRNAKRLINY